MLNKGVSAGEVYDDMVKTYGKENADAMMATLSSPTSQKKSGNIWTTIKNQYNTAKKVANNAKKVANGVATIADKVYVEPIRNQINTVKGAVKNTTKLVGTIYEEPVNDLKRLLTVPTITK